MLDDDLLFCRRMEELSSRAFSRNCYTQTEFLTLAQQDMLLHQSLPLAPTLWGGFDEAERKIATFGDPSLCGYEAPESVCCLKIAPRGAKFADALTHRDFLGSLMALGVRRELLGDILIENSTGYLFCLDSIADYLAEQLTQVRHTSVCCARCEAPAMALRQPDVSMVNVASSRLDALLAAVFHLSRSAAQQLIAQEKVFLDSRLCLSASTQIREGALISARGYGRFRFESVEAQTRKGRLRVAIRNYQQ